MLKRILLVLAALVIVLILVIALQDATFEVKRSAELHAPPATVYAQVASFKNWHAWSPWDDLEPDMERTYSGAESGEGAHYAWKGKDKAGEGSMTITNARAPEHLGLDLDFLKPFPAHNRVDFDFAGSGETTTVTWTMSGTKNFGAKAFGLVMNMDKLVGGDFEKGLAKLKQVSEAAYDAEQKKAADDAAAAAAAPAEAEPVDAGTP